MNFVSNIRVSILQHWTTVGGRAIMLRSVVATSKRAIRQVNAGIIGTAVSLAMLVCGLPSTAMAETPTSVNMKMLVLSADGTEPSFAAITSVLDQLDVPYDAVIASKTSLDSIALSDGLGNGKYQGILLATGNLGYASNGQWQSALTAAQWQKLWTYESTFKVRQVTLYTYPAGLPDNYCLANPSGVSTDTTAISATLSAQGKTAFNYLNTNNPVKIQNAWTYLAQSSPATGQTITPLLSYGSNPIVSICGYADGRQNLTITADSNPNLIHALQLGYGIVNWVSKGFFIGQRQVYMNAQPDDVMIEDDMWDLATLTDTSGKTFRISGADFTALTKWQQGLQARDSKFANIAMELPYNGVGLSGIYSDTTLGTSITANEFDFKWISHTYDHENLDTISSSAATNELKWNNQTRNNIGFEKYFKDSMIQPDISGLGNANFLTAAYNFGIRNLLCDLSKPGCAQAKPNTGYYIDPSMLPATATQKMLVIPRYAANLYYNVSTPDEWVSEYNHIYGPKGTAPYFSSDQTYSQIINTESDNWLRYMIKYSVYSVMFHQPNLRAYDGVHSLLGDLMDATLNKYSALFSLPVSSPSQHAQAALINSRMTFDAAGVTGVLKLGTTNTVSITAAKAASVPLTGITAGTSSTYGGQTQSTVAVGAGATVTANAPAW